MSVTGRTAKRNRRTIAIRSRLGDLDMAGVESGETSVVKQWHFVENESRPGRWRWQLLTSDDEIQSEQFDSYGDAVAHAIRQGFRPSEDKWVVVALHTIARFKKTPVATSKSWPEQKAS
jgi:hypothetical protein